MVVAAMVGAAGRRQAGGDELPLGSVRPSVCALVVTQVGLPVSFPRGFLRGDGLTEFEVCSNGGNVNYGDIFISFVIICIACLYILSL